ncbi:MAG: EAL and GGDEF domain-containing protein [Lachnospiraceae bacterium]|nr:EAL and GGDEF domain-containing protein [Lachnospiraceae bacterium]
MESRIKMVYDEREELESIIENKRIRSVFQPVVSLRDGSVYGYEALSRIEDGNVICTPDQLFTIAPKYKMLWITEQLCRKKALKKLYENRDKLQDKKLFLNVSPKIIYDDKFKTGFTKEYLLRYGIDPAQIVFELTERDANMDLLGFEKVLCHYKKPKYEIAIDDLGSCYSGLNLMCTIQPHFLKIDMQIVHGLNQNRNKYALIKSLSEYATLTNTQLIAEGIETVEELETLIQIGIHYGQGYLLGRPAEEICDINPKIAKKIKECNIAKHNTSNHDMNHFYTRHICMKCLTVPESRTVEEVLSYFEENLHVPGICVTRDDKVLGIVTREKLQQILSGRYGFSLHQKKQVSSIMDKDFLSVDGYTSIGVVSSIAMERSEKNLYDFVVVTDREKYLGIVTVKELLIKSTELSIHAAKSSNPLTGLPGNLIINEKMTKLIEEKLEYTVMYLDMDNFKAFNDVYGFERGDEVIRTLAQILEKNVEKEGFIGHVGGDDFVVILYHNRYESYIPGITGEFEEKTHALYTKEDQQNQYIETKNRHGEIERFPLMSITIVLTTDKEKNYRNQYELAEELALRKKIAKQKTGELYQKA